MCWGGGQTPAGRGQRCRGPALCLLPTRCRLRGRLPHTQRFARSSGLGVRPSKFLRQMGCVSGQLAESWRKGPECCFLSPALTRCKQITSAHKSVTCPTTLPGKPTSQARASVNVPKGAQSLYYSCISAPIQGCRSLTDP